MEDLIQLAVDNDEMQTLIRVLASAGSKGSLALLQLSLDLRKAAAAKDALCLQAGLVHDPGGSNQEGQSAGGGPYDRLSVKHLHQLLYRSFLGLSVPDAAGIPQFFCIL